MKDFIEIGKSRWELIEATKTMHFKASPHLNNRKKIRLIFAINLPFDCEFMVDLSKEEAKKLIVQLERSITGEY